jgi:uncharacterized caspase-like protein
LSVLRTVLVLLLLGAGLSSAAAQAPGRLALIVGNSAYQNAPPVRTALADAGLVAETMRAAGYAVTELQDVRADDIGAAIGEFLDQVEAAGPEAVVFFYFTGYAVQSGADNFLVPVDAEIAGEEDVPNQAFRLSDMLNELAGMQVAARIVVIDGAREYPIAGRSLARGLALVDAPPGSLLAFSASPGALANDGDGETSIYPTALVSLMRDPGLEIDQIFRAVRLQVNQETGGAQTPWMQSSLDVEVVLFEGQPSQAAPAGPQQAAPRVPPRAPRTVTRPVLADMSPEEAYYLVIERDTLEAYQWFVELYPTSRYAAEIWELIALRREAILWRRALIQNTRRAYWNYLRRYPDGAHVQEARLRLQALSAPMEPPSDYDDEPEPLPPGYYDEGVGLVEILPQGAPPPPRVFGGGPPMFIAPPPPRFVRPFRPQYRPPPPPAFVTRPPRLVARPPRETRRPPGQWVRPPARPIGTGRPTTRPPRPGVGLPPSGARPGRPGARPGRPTAPARPGVGLPPRQQTQPGRPQPAGPSGRPQQPAAQPQRPVGQPQRPQTGRPVGQPQRPQTGRPTGQPQRPVGQPQRPQPVGPSGQPQRPAAQPQRPVGQPQRPQTGRPVGQPQRPQTGRPTGQPQRPVGQPQRPQPAGPSGLPQRPVGQPQRPQTGRPPGQPQRPAMQPQRPQGQPQRPQGQPQRPAAQPQRPPSQPQRPAMQPQRPPSQPQRPATQPQRPAAQP